MSYIKDIKKSINIFLKANKKLLKKIKITPKERLEYFEKNILFELCNKMFYTTVLLNTTQLDILKYAKYYNIYVNEILYEWDVITDMIVMNAIKRNR